MIKTVISNLINKITKPVENMDVTIVIPSKGRLAEIKALLGYFAKKKIKKKILVLESGRDYGDLVAEFLDLNLEILHFEDDISFGTKVLDGIKLVTTPFVCLCTDDDLVLSKSIDECADFLSANPDYSACQGYHARFAIEQERIDLHDVLWFTPSIESSDSLTRLSELIGRYQPICWALFRTDIARKAVEAFDQVKSYLFLELIWSVTSILFGKVKRIPQIYCLRRVDEVNLKGHPFYLFTESPEDFLADYHDYREYIVNSLSSEVPHEKKELRRVIDLIHLKLFYGAVDPNIFNYFLDRVTKNPQASILDPTIYQLVKIPLPEFETKDSMEIQCENWLFRISKKFILPEPREEIHLLKNHHLKIVKEFSFYTSNFQSPKYLKN